MAVMGLYIVNLPESTRVCWARVPGAHHYEVERTDSPTVEVTYECAFVDTDFRDERSGRRYAVRAVGPDSMITGPLLPEPCPSCGKLP